MLNFGCWARRSAMAALLLLAVGCKSVHVRQSRQMDSIRLSSIAATEIAATDRSQRFERVETISIMELDTATGELRETRRETRRETISDNVVENIENKAENNAIETFSVQNDITNHETRQIVADDTKTALRWQRRIIFLIIAAIVVGLLFLRLKMKGFFK